MDKLSNAQLAEVITDGAATLRAQQEHINSLEEKLASRERRDRVEKLASAMHGKGLELDVAAGDLADRLEKVASTEIEAYEKAVDLVGPDMSMKFGSAGNSPSNNDDPGSPGNSSDLERFIVGGVG